MVLLGDILLVVGVVLWITKIGLLTWLGLLSASSGIILLWFYYEASDDHLIAIKKHMSRIGRLHNKLALDFLRNKFDTDKTREIMVEHIHGIKRVITATEIDDMEKTILDTLIKLAENEEEMEQKGE